MLDFLNQGGANIPGLAAVFVAVFLLNIIPIFAPPTWIVLSAISLGVPDALPHGLALVAATAATCGRVVLAKMSRGILRGKLLGEDARRNVDEIRKGIEAHRLASAGAMILYAFSPLPSNHLFIAYGLTNLPVLFAAVPFFLGRLVSYSFWIFSAAAAGRKFDIDLAESSFGFGLYFIVTQLLLIPTIYFLVKIDWNALINDRRFALRRSRLRE
jgi:membrane protein YqaA with SNARE-associated domain